MNKFKTILATTIFFLVSLAQYAQTSEKLNSAEDLLNKYLTASKFEENGQFQINENTRNSFTELFKKDAHIIFDVPLSSDAFIKSNTKKYGNQERHQSSVISIFGKDVSPEMYVATLEKEIKEQIVIMTLPTGRRDISGIDSSGLVVFEIEKSFQEKDSLTNSVKYLLEIDVSGHKPLISGIRVNKENILKRNVLIQLFNDSRAATKVNTFTCVITIEFHASINNTIDTVQSFDGKIRLELANRATLKIIKAHDQEAIDYEIPFEWKEKGKKVSDQPEDGFEVNLMPKLWNGWAYTVDIHGGYFQQSQINTGNFRYDSEFINDPGYRVGGEFLVTKYFNPGKWKQSGWLIGIGIGVNIGYQQTSTSSADFTQDSLRYVDAVGDDCYVKYKGSSFTETMDILDVAVPVFFDFRTRLGRKVSLTIQPGLNVVYPLRINYKSEGDFSRWGYYEFNGYDPPITHDPVYNYYTNEAKIYQGEGTYSLQVDGQLRVNFLLNIFKKNPDNALLLGFLGSLPLTNTPSYTYTDGSASDWNYSGYWINTENDEYHSLMYSRDKPYDFYIGLSVGINLVKYKAK